MEGSQIFLALVCCSLLSQVEAQGQRCEVPSDCKDEYNPFCSKWGYCISYNLFGEEGPGQSKGAVEDGSRGQCRDDKDCTPWAPTCGALGYCRGGVQDGSFGSPTNPKAGGKASKWIQANAKSGAGRTEEYYGKIEDDNLRAHKKFRKDNPIFYEQIPVLLPRLRAIEKNVYTPCTYCKETLDGEDEGGKGVKRGGSGSKGGKPRGGGSRGKASKKGGSRRDTPRSSGQKKSGGNANFLKEIAAGRIPGKAGKDYPTHSLSKFKGAKPAPQDKIPKNYPKNGGRKSDGGRKSGGGGAGGRKSGGGAGGRKGGGGGDCPGTMEDCIDVCPSEKRVYRSCVSSCGRRCEKK